MGPQCLHRPAHPHGRGGRFVLSAAFRERSRAGSATQGGVVGSSVIGGSPLANFDLTATAPFIELARSAAAAPTVGRNGAPKPNELARASALGGRGAAPAAC